MNFQPYTTLWDIAGKSMRQKFSGPKSFYDYLNANMPECPERDTRLRRQFLLAMEEEWIKGGRPYYKVFPEYAAMLGKTTLDVPSSVLKPAHKIFSIHLSNAHPGIDFEVDGVKYESRSFLVCCTEGNGEKRCLSWHVRIVDFSVHPLIVMPEGDNSIEELWDNRIAKDSITETAILLSCQKLLRLLIGTILLSISAHRCVEHDVLEKLREKYDLASTKEEREAIAEKSRRNGVNGYRIGRSLSLQTIHEDREHSESDRHLRWQHIRGGHFHTVLKGWGRSERVVQWFEPTIVRRDLPVKPIG